MTESNIKYFSYEKSFIVGDSKICTPKDAALQFLKEIADGDIEPSKVMICFHDKKDDGVYYFSAGGTRLESIGILEMIKQKIS